MTDAPDPGALAGTLPIAAWRERLDAARQAEPQESLRLSAGLLEEFESGLGSL